MAKTQKPEPAVDEPVVDEPADMAAATDPLLEGDVRVRARFVDVQAVLVAGRIVRYGDEVTVTAGQVAADPRFIAFDEDWTPDPAAEAAATLEG